MDKNLKKLNRTELLELLIQASEDKDAVIAENLELRSRLMQQQQRQQEEQQRQAHPYAGMKVGSIAEAALQANGYFESAQQAADEYLREIKRMRDQVAARAQSTLVKDSIAAAQAVQPVAQQASMQDQQSVEQAQAIANQIVQRASIQAHTMLEEAQAKSDAMVAEARRQADAAIVDANRQAHAIVSRANRRAEALIAATSESTPRVDRPQTLATEAAPRADRSPSSTSEIQLRGRHAKRSGNEGQAA